MDYSIHYNHQNCHPETCCHTYNWSLWRTTDSGTKQRIAESDSKKEIYLLKERQELQDQHDRLLKLYAEKLERDAKQNSSQQKTGADQTQF